jgi:hypothetical protein
MQTTLHDIQLAESLHSERSGIRHGRSTQERSPTLRARVGNRLISVGERLAGTRTAAAAR